MNRPERRTLHLEQLPGNQQWNDVPSFTAIDPKIAVRRHYLAGIAQLGHADKAGVSQTHWAIGVFSQKTKDIGAMVFQHEIRLHYAALDKLKDRLRVDVLGLQKENRF